MPLNKIVSIKSVGRFLDCRAAGDVSFKQATLVFAENGRGKTTFCAILRSLQSSDASHVLGRRTLGFSGDPDIHLLVDNSPAIFRGGAWNRIVPNLAVFDATFVSQNVFSGDAVATEHRRNLYRVIIGSTGVGLAQTIDELDAKIRAKNGELADQQAQIQPFIGRGTTFDSFMLLPEDPDVEAKIDVKERELVAVKQSDIIKTRPVLAGITVPTLSFELGVLLASTLEGVAKDAEGKIAAHLARHEMNVRGESWLEEGARHTTHEECPFCGQNLEPSALAKLYTSYFSEAYSTLKGQIATKRQELETAFGDRVLAAIDRVIDQNRASIEFWQSFCEFEPPSAKELETLTDALGNLRIAILDVLARKSASPLDAIEKGASLIAAENELANATARLEIYNELVHKANERITSRKQQVEAANVSAVESDLNSLRLAQERHKREVRDICDAYVKISAEKATLVREKDSTRTRLDEHTDQIITRYGQTINNYLDRFNAGFKISAPTYTYRGGPPSSTYQIIINNQPVELGDNQTPLDRPSFRNTLSSGDRSTLALAFFLAQLDHDANSADTIVVFDDPFTSQDGFRRNNTAIQIKRAAGIFAQVVVLSHDQGFLKLVWDKLDAAQRKTIQLARINEENTAVAEWDIERAMEASYRADSHALQKYYSAGEGSQRDVVQKIRPVLEGFCRNLYPNELSDADTMGAIVAKIRSGGPANLLIAICDELDEINDYCRKYHHADNPNADRERINDGELKGYIGRTLKLTSFY